jgi:hypothetical protein
MGIAFDSEVVTMNLLLSLISFKQIKFIVNTP